MKNLLFILLSTIALTSFAQGSRVTCECFDCCPKYITVTLNSGQIDSLHQDSLLIISPAASKGIRLTKPPVMRVIQGDTAIVFASNEFIKVINEFGDATGYDGGEMSIFPDKQVTPYAGISTGTFWQSYFCPANGQNTPSIPHTCTGAIYLWASFPLLADNDSKIVVTIWYEEIPGL